MKHLLLLIVFLTLISLTFAGPAELSSVSATTITKGDHRPDVVNPDFRYGDCYATSPSYEWISNVNFAGIDNTSTGTDDPDANGQIGYDNFVGIAATANVFAGNTYTLSVTITADGTEYVFAWIDWNNDDTFDTATEQYIVVNGTTSAGTYTCNVDVPVGATIGTTRMRVALRYSEAPIPVGNWYYGEVEDYAVQVFSSGVELPLLSAGTVTPGQGVSSTTFTYSVQYKHTGGDAPTAMELYIDGALNGTMTGPGGTPDWSEWQTFTRTVNDLSTGGHTYYFRFVSGTEVLLPSTAPATPFNGPVIVTPYTSFPFSEDFSTWPPANLALSGTEEWAAYQDVDLSLNCAFANFWSWSTGTAIMTTPLMELPTNQELSFLWSHAYHSSYPNDRLLVEITSDFGTTWTPLWDITTTEFNSDDGAGNTNPGSFAYKAISLASYGGQNVIIRFNAISGYGPDLYIDDIMIDTLSSDPVFRVSPAALSFGGVPVLTTSPEGIITVSNSGINDLIIESAPSLSGPHYTEFALTDSYTYPLTVTSTTPVAFHLTFTPATNGDRTAVLTFTHNGAEGRTTNTVNLSGVGQIPIVPADNAVITQMPDNGTIMTADADPGYLRFDNANFTGNLTGMRLWGSLAYYDGGTWSGAFQDPISMVIGFYASDSTGYPNIVSPIIEFTYPSLSPLNTGNVVFDPYFTYQYDLVFPSPVAVVGDFWVGVWANADGNTCWNMLISSSDGNSSSYYYDTNSSSWTIQSYDFAMCLTGTEVIAAPTNLLVAIANDNVSVTWDAVPGANSYKVYRSTDPYAADWGIPVQTVDTPAYSEPASGTKYFYRVVASSDTP